jgi:LAO/AO transport system kinase
LATEQYVQGILAGEQDVLSRFIRLLESQLAEDRRRAQRVLTALLTHSGRSIRVGITGMPGAGKSSLIESLGLRLRLLAATLGDLYPCDEEPDAP